MSGIVGLAFVDHETWTIIRCNAQFGRILGYDEAELVGRSLEDLYHISDAGTYRESLRRVLEGSEDYLDSIKRFVTKAGVGVICRSICHPLRYNGKVVVMLKQMVILSDDRLMSESIALRETVTRLESDLMNLRGDVMALVGRRSDINIGGSNITSGASTNDASIFRWLVLALIVVAGIATYGIYIGGWQLHGGHAKPPAVQSDKDVAP